MGLHLRAGIQNAAREAASVVFALPVEATEKLIRIKARVRCAGKNVL
jgi:prephenate dehydrogenase